MGQRRGGWWGPVAAVSALALAVAAPAAAGSSEPVEPVEPMPWEQGGGGDRPVLDDVWFVELEGQPSARGGSPPQHAAERAQLRAEADQEQVPVREREDYTTLWNGLSVDADASEIAAIRRLDGVAAVHPVAVVDTPEPEDVDPELGTALAMTGADVSRSELGLTGDGLSVAVIDTGIDYNHPDLGGGGDADHRIEASDDRTLDHPRISHGYDYVGDDFDPSDPDAPAEPAPNPDPMDVQGHGTHVAGIVGAEAADEEDGATGVAPGVTLGAYKVFGTGSTSSEVIVEALEDAYEDGMDIVNMSLGAAFAWGQDYPTTAASNELTAQGVTVVNSAGNSGADGAWTLSAPANAHDVISVASADNTEQEASIFEVEQLDDPVAYAELSGAELPPEEGTSDELVHLGRACVDSEGDELEGDPDGRTALIERGTCPFAEKYVAAADEGATGVVIYNEDPGLFAGTVEDAGVEGVWGAGIPGESGQALVDLLADGESVELEFTDETATAISPTGGLVSAFSSFGQDVELAFGPSVLAPGGMISSTYPLDAGPYATLSGTSMAAPHVAGAVALLWEAEADLDPLDIRDRLQNTAEPAPWSGNPDAGLLDHTFRQGAGMLRIDLAAEAEQSVTPAQLALGDEDVTATTLSVTNSGDEELVYDVGHEPAVATAFSSFTPGIYLTDAEVETPESVVVPAGATVEVPVSVASPQAGLPNNQYGGYVTFEAEDADTLRVPYAGFDGDYVEEMALFGHWGLHEEGGPAFEEVEPVLGSLVEEDGEAEVDPVEPGHTFAPRDGDVPVVDAFFGHYPQEMELWAERQSGDGERHLVATDEHLPRSAGPQDRLPIAWDGLVAAGGSDNARAVPSGDYVLELRVLRALGDPEDPDHWDVWESPEVELDTRGGGPPEGRGGPPAERGPR